jgi:tetratricopeptide (TPR) repeat protein
MGRWQDAGECFRIAIQLNPGQPLYHRNLGDIYFTLQRKAEAEAEYRRAVELEPEGRDSLLRLAAFYHFVGSFEKARSVYERALALTRDPNQREAIQKLIDRCAAGRLP